MSVETESQRKMKEIWLSILGEAAQAHSVNPASDFFLVGGNSLLLISVQAEIQQSVQGDSSPGAALPGERARTDGWVADY